MKTVRVEFAVKIPDNITNTEILDWLRFELDESGTLNRDNPLADTGIEALPLSVSVEEY